MSDEIFSAVYARPKRRQGITGQTIDAQMRGTMCQITELELEELRDELARLRAASEGVIDRQFAELRFNQIRDEAVAELSRLRAEVERLTGALEGALADSARLTLALADERRHADALADTLYSMDGLQKIDCEMRDNAVQQHRARRQGFA